MTKMYLKIFFIALSVMVAYLYLSHTYTYRKIHRASLKATDNRHTYNIMNNQDKQTRSLYAAIGDSLTSGVGTEKYEESFPFVLAQLMGKNKNNIVHENFSYPGARTKDVINDLLKPATESQADIITLLIGTNDVHGYVGEEAFKKNYDFILQELSAKTKAQIYVISIPLIGSNTLIIPPHDIYLKKQTQDFNAIIFSLAKKYQVNYIDLYTPTEALLSQDGPHYSIDSFHPSAQGYAWWAKIVYDNINK